MKIGETPNIHGRHLWIGDYGAGKTYMLGQIHNELKKNGSKGLYLMDVDIGHKTLKSAGIADDMELKMLVGAGAYPEFADLLKGFAEDTRGYGGIAIDSLTSLEKIILKHIMTEIAAGKDRPLGFLPSLQDQGALVNMIETIMPYLMAISLKMEVIMTAHLQERKSEDTGILWKLPCVTGRKLPSKLGSYFNEVWLIDAQMMDGKIVRTAQTATYDRNKCKTQIKDMPLKLSTDEAIKLAIKAYEIGEGAILDADETIEQATEVIEEVEQPTPELGVPDPDTKVEPTREELMAQVKS